MTTALHLRTTGLRERLADWDRRSLASSIAFVLLGGLVYCAVLGSRVRFPDESDYLTLSRGLADTGRYSLDGSAPTALRPPGYGYFLAAFRFLGTPVAGLRFANFVCLALMVWAGWWLAQRIGGRVAATIAAPVIALYPLGFYTTGAFYPQAFGGALALGGLVALAQIKGSRHPYVLSAAAGMAFGALLVTIPPLATVLVVGVIWLGMTDRRVRTVVLVVGFAAILPLCWTARNIAVMHAPVLGATNNGKNLLLGNSPDAGPRKGVAADVRAYTQVSDQMGEVDGDNYLRDQALEWMRSHPADAAALYVGKSLNYFAPFDQLGTASENSVGQQALATITYLPLLALFALRLARWRRERPGELERLLIVVYVIAAPFQAIFVTRVRYRVPLEPLLVVVVASMIARWLARHADDPTGTPAAIGGPGASPTLEPAG